MPAAQGTLQGSSDFNNKIKAKVLILSLFTRNKVISIF